MASSAGQGASIFSDGDPLRNDGPLLKPLIGEALMDLGLRGKTALVLGAGGGLGRAIAKALAGEGARVAVGDRNAEYLEPTLEDIAAAGSEGLPLAWDLAACL